MIKKGLGELLERKFGSIWDVIHMDRFVLLLQVSKSFLAKNFLRKWNQMEYISWEKYADVRCQCGVENVQNTVKYSEIIDNKVKKLENIS